MPTDSHPCPASGTPSWNTYPITEKADRCSPPVALWTILGLSAVLWWGGISLVGMAG